MQQRQIVDHPQILCPLDNGQVIEREVDIPRIRHPVNMCVPADPTPRFGIDESLGNQCHITRLTRLEVYSFGGENMFKSTFKCHRGLSWREIDLETSIGIEERHSRHSY